MRQGKSRGLEDQGGNERLLGPEAVAVMLGVPKSTLYAWRYRSEGPPSLRVGKHLRYRRADVLSWIEQQKDRGRTP
jgi:excisionase family DNA binding protein